MHTWNRRALSLAVLFFSAFIVFAGGSSEAGGTGAGQTTLTFWRAGSDQLETDYWNAAIQLYEAKNPTVNIELTSIPWGNEIETKLNTAYVGGTFPDVVSYSIASIAGHADAGQYAVLDPYVEKWDGRSDMIEHILNLGDYQGKLYGIGFIPDPRVFVWRKDYFEEAGLDPNRPPQTWEELRDYAIKLTKIENGVTVRGGFSIRYLVDNGDAAQDWQTFALQNGSPIIDVPNNKALFNNPKGVEAAAYLADLFHHGVSPQLGPGQDAFALGRVAMAYANPSSVQSLLNDNPDLAGKVGYASPLSREQRATFAGLRLLFIGSTSKHKDAAWDYISFLLSSDETWRRYEQMKSPVVLQSLQDKFVADNPEVNKAVFDAIAVGRGYPTVRYSFSFMELISRALQTAYLTDTPAADAFAQAEQEFNKQLPSWLGE